MWATIYCHMCKSKIISIYILAAVCCLLPVIKAAGCGGYIEPVAGSSGTIRSKNYGIGDYDPYTNCIWILEAQNGHQVQVTINSFVGEMFDGVCADFIEIRDGSASSDLVFESCGTLTNQVVTSTARWMYFRFKTDAVNATTGLDATYTAVHVGDVISNVSAPFQSCRSHEFECSNKICLVRSYLCDDYNDCGCDVNCDENDCAGIGIEKFTRIGFSAGIGAGLFIIICIVIFFTDRYSKRKEIRRQQEEEERQKKGRGKVKRADKDDKKAAAKRKTLFEKAKVSPEPKKNPENSVYWHS